jgi:hypothetical protein
MGLRILGSCSTPTAPTSFLIHFTGLAKTARQQKAALTAGQRRRTSKDSRHGWQADPITIWKWRDCSAGGIGCCSALSVPKSFTQALTGGIFCPALRASFLIRNEIIWSSLPINNYMRRCDPDKSDLTITSECATIRPQSMHRLSGGPACD